MEEGPAAPPDLSADSNSPVTYLLNNSIAQNAHLGAHFRPDEETMGNVAESFNRSPIAFVLSLSVDTPVAAVGREDAPTFDVQSADASTLVQYERLVFDIDLSTPEVVQHARQVLSAIPLQQRPRLIFAAERGSRRHQQTVQANALGASTVVARPASMAAIRALDGIPEPPARPAPSPWLESASITAGVRMLEASFAALATGAPLDVDQAASASRELLSGLGQENLHVWLEAVRSHHSGTFQHCLLVTGAAAAFANHAGLSERDRMQVTMAALLHDIGKAEIPNSILDKPGRLTDEEFAIIRRHPKVGADYLKRQKGVPAAVLDAVLQHHEYLDGSGYPSGLSGDRISPLARTLTVCDVYGAMVEERSYKPAKTQAEALYVLISMAQAGKVDLRLVRTLADALGTVLPRRETVSAA